MKMDSPTNLQEIVIYGCGAAASLPIAVLTIYAMGTTYSAIRSTGEKMFHNPEQLSFKDLYHKNLHNFLEPREE